MSVTSSYGINLSLTYGLQQQQLAISQLGQQITTGQQYSNLTDYNPTDASTLLSAQSAITQRQSYTSSMQAVTTRLSVYDTTMSDIEGMASNASQLATQNSSYVSTTVDSIQQQATNYLQQMQDDLNQQVGGRYIYAGTRYGTQPVVNLTSLTGSPSATPTASPALPPYDADYSTATSFTINSAPSNGSSTFTIGNLSIPWSEIKSGSVTSITVNGAAYTPSPAITGLTAPVTTTAQLASNLSATLNQLAAQVPSTSGIAALTTTASGSGVTMNFNGTAPQTVTPDNGGNLGEMTWAGGSAVAGTTSITPTSGINAVSVNGRPTGNFIAGNVTIPWAQLESPSGASMTVNYTINGTSESVTVGGLSTAGTSAAYAQNMTATLNAIAAATTNPANTIGGLSASHSSGSNVIALSFGSSPAQMVTPDSGGVGTETSWIGGTAPDGTTAQTPNSSVAAYTKDSVLIDQNYTVNYGVSSDDPAFQNVVNGLRYIIAACAAGKSGDTATYQADMEQASTLINNGLTGVQSLHAQVSNNQNIMSSETSTQNADITALQNQMSNIQGIDISTVGTEINLLQTQLQASYSATASLEKLSLVTYL